MTDVEIRRVLKKNNIGGVKGILRGKFEPFKVTKKNRQEMRDDGISDRFDNSSTIEIQRPMRNLPLDPEAEPRPPLAPTQVPTAPSTNPFLSPSAPTPTAPSTNPFLSPSAPTPAAPSTNPFLSPQQQGNLPQPAPTITQASATGPVNPALLGGTPEERAANAFLQRT